MSCSSLAERGAQARAPHTHTLLPPAAWRRVLMASDAVPVESDTVVDARMGIAALRAWFFLTVTTTDDPDNVISPFPSFPEVELLNEMDAPPPDVEPPPPGAMSIFDFYKSFARDAKLAEEAEEREVPERAMPANRACRFLKLSPEHVITPNINVGVRFLFHLSHALKTLTPPGIERVHADPCVAVDLPLDWGRLLHMFPPSVVNDPSDEHKAIWADPETGTYDDQEFVGHLNCHFHVALGAHTAFPGIVTMQVKCLLCESYSKVVEDMGAAVASIEVYAKAMAKFCCPHCGLWFSCLNPSVQIAFGGIRRR